MSDNNNLINNNCSCNNTNNILHHYSFREPNKATLKSNHVLNAQIDSSISPFLIAAMLIVPIAGGMYLLGEYYSKIDGPHDILNL